MWLMEGNLSEEFSKYLTPHLISTELKKKSFFIHTQIYIDVGLLN